MKKLIIVISVCIASLQLSAQTMPDYKDLDSASKAKVDSIVQRHRIIQGSASHRMMVSFSEWNIDMLNPFFLFLINNLNYATNQVGTAEKRQMEIRKTKTGFVTELYKYNGYGSEPAKLKITFTCNSDGSQITQTKITGPFNLLSEIYLQYFEGHVEPNLPAKGGIDRMYNITDEIRIYPDYILIKPHHNKLSFE